MKRLAPVVAVVVLGSLAVACGGPSSPGALPRLEVESVSSGGFTGWVTRLEVWSDGRLVLDENGVRRFGRARSSTLEELRDAVSSSAFQQLAPAYGTPGACCDMPTTGIRVFRERGTQSVTVHPLADPPAPLERALRALHALEESLR